MKLRDRIKQKLRHMYETAKRWWNILKAPHLLICVGVAWMITNGWCYLAVVFGRTLGFKWLTRVGTAYLAFLWLPFTPEKIVTVLIAMLLHRILYPNDGKTLRVLRALYREARGKKRMRSKRPKRAHVYKTAYVYRKKRSEDEPIGANKQCV
ncbi:MAG: hypothetical protein IKR85_01360 [Clostridia bacterium]|nr:hypothetical protein [Clostridia bacterium]